MKQSRVEGKAALYTRVSTTYQVDKESLPHQRNELINYAHYVLHIDSYEVFEDAGFSGKNTDRPAFQDMMRRIRLGEFSHLVVDKIDRISRNLLDFAAMYEELKSLDVTFVSRNEQFDTSNAMGEAMLKIILVFAELERHVTSERVTAVMIDRASKGKWNGANVPLGYKWSEEQKFPVIDEKESKIVKNIFDRYTAGDSMTIISRYLNDHHIKTKRNGEWTASSVGQILENPFYKGTLRYNYRNAARGKIKKEEEWIVIDNNHPGIVTVEQWENVQKLRKRNRKGEWSHKQIHDHVFGGIMYCACGSSAISSYSRPENYSRYTCLKRRERGRNYCDNRHTINDVTLGNFVFTYLQNMIYIQSNFGEIKNNEILEKELLHGAGMAEVSYIDSNSLQEIYDSFIRRSDVVYNQDENAVESLETDRYTQLATEKQNHQRALERLNNLFLYSEDALSEKDYLIEKNRIQESIRKIDSLLSQEESQKVATNKDLEFIKCAGDFLIKSIIIKRGAFDWRLFAKNAGAKNINTFLRTVINKIVYYDNRVVSIEFKNGIVHRFVYK